MGLSVVCRFRALTGDTIRACDSMPGMANSSGIAAAPISAACCGGGGERSRVRSGVEAKVCGGSLTLVERDPPLRIRKCEHQRDVANGIDGSRDPAINGKQQTSDTPN